VGEGEGTVDAVNGVYSCIKFHLSIEIRFYGDELYILSARPNFMLNSMPPDSSVHLPLEAPPTTSLPGDRKIILF